MEHVPIRVGQVRETPYRNRYVVVDINGARANVVMRGAAYEWFQFSMHRDPVVGWSRGHLPPPVLTANPAEVVEGEVRWDGEPYYVDHFTQDGGVVLRWDDVGAGIIGHEPQLISEDRLVARPGVTL